jgi:hypothetical protein
MIIASGLRALALYTERETAQLLKLLDTENLTRYFAKVRAMQLLVFRVAPVNWRVVRL